MKINNLIYKKTKSNIDYYGDEADIIVKIRLNDECKNGHQDFSITASIYKAGFRGDRSLLAGGCCHDEIVKHFPEFKLFVDLHLCDYSGVPMHAVANGLYHIRNGFNNTKVTDSNFKKEYCKYYRLTPLQFDRLNESENKIEFAILLKELNILKNWNTEAKKAIGILENLTGKQFLNDSKKSQYVQPSDQEIKEFTKNKETGYYSLENKRIRAKEERRAKKEKVIREIKEYYLKKEKEEREGKIVKLFILSNIEKLHSKKRHKFSLDFSFENFIYYQHRQEVVFNWLDWKNEINEREFELFCNNIKESDYNRLPNGIKFTLKGVKTFSN